MAWKSYLKFKVLGLSRDSKDLKMVVSMGKFWGLRTKETVPQHWDTR